MLEPDGPGHLEHARDQQQHPSHGILPFATMRAGRRDARGILTSPTDCGGMPMKVKLDIECTPAEARAFFGLPDVAPLQERVMKEVEQRVMQGIGAMDPAEMLKTWMPATMQGFDQMQRFWSQVAAGAVDPNRK
jgi:hypothetical protein